MQDYGGAQEPAGRQVIGILNIVWGALNAALAALFIFVSAAVLAGGAVLGASNSEGAAPLGGLVAAGGLIGIIFFGAYLVLSVMLIAGGSGILKMQPKGYTTTMLVAWISLALNIAQLIMTGFGSGMCNFIGMVYPVVLLILLNQPDWKRAFGQT